MRGISKVARDYWDYTTLDREILDDAARLTEKDLLELVSCKRLNTQF
jgi:glucosamine-6-phosphate deaminase